MKRRKFIGLSAAGIAGTASAVPSVFHAGNPEQEEKAAFQKRELNPNAKWMQDAKWGIFTHYLGGGSAERLNKKVNSFQVKSFADQLSELKAPYFFITIGQGGHYYCSPNRTFEKLFDPGKGARSDRDLIADLAAELIPRKIRLCVYLANIGRRATPEEQEIYLKGIREWSERWGDSISAWWIDGGVFEGPDLYKEYTLAYKAGNPKALVCYNPGPVGMTRDLRGPVTEYEDYLAGETNWHLPVSGFRPWDKKEYYLGPDISGDQLHFLTFMGSFWGRGEPRFPDELVIGWNKHIANHGGTISWDVPLTDYGEISDSYMRQLTQLSRKIL